MTWLTLNLWWAFNLMFLVWWLGIRLMSLLTPGLQSSLLLVSTFILGSQVRCHHWPIFSWKLGCEDYSFLDQAVADFKQGLDSSHTDSIETPELDIFLNVSDAITSSVSSGFLCSVSTISDNSKPQITPSIRSFLTPELSLLILFLLILLLSEALHLCLKCLNYLSRFMTLWTMSVQMSWELHLYFSMCLTLLSGSTMRSRPHRSPFFRVSRMWFLLIRNQTTQPMFSLSDASVLLSFTNCHTSFLIKIDSDLLYVKDWSK